MPYTHKVHYQYLLVLVLLWMACKPKSTQFISTYHGVSKAHYEHLEFDTLTGGFNLIEWDSVYSDKIIVEKNTAFNSLTIYLDESKHLASGNEFTFSFNIDQPSYIHYTSDSSYERFIISSSQMSWNHYFKEGNDSNYVVKKIDFTGE